VCVSCCLICSMSKKTGHMCVCLCMHIIIAFLARSETETETKTKQKPEPQHSSVCFAVGKWHISLAFHYFLVVSIF